MRTRHTPEYLASKIIHDDRFNADRERREAHTRVYDEGMRELNAPYPEQREPTRGPDPISDDMAWFAFALLYAVLFGVLAVIVKFKVWEWFA